MAKYRVLTKSFIGNAIVEAGELVDYDGVPGSNLELVEGEAPKAAPKTEVKAKAKGSAKAAAPVADPGADLV